MRMKNPREKGNNGSGRREIIRETVGKVEIRDDFQCKSLARNVLLSVKEGRGDGLRGLRELGVGRIIDEEEDRGC